MNFRALAECANTTINNVTLLAYAGTYFNFTYFPFLQGITPNSCMNLYHPDSPTVLNATLAVYI